MRMGVSIDYGVAKAFALKGLLLSYAELEELAEAGSLDDFMEKLRPSVYGRYIADIPKPYTVLGSEMAFKRHLIDTHYRLMNVSPNSDVLIAYFMKYPASNLKTVLKAKALEKPFEEIESAIDLYAETLLRIRDEVLRAATARDLREAVRELENTYLAKVADLALRVWESKKDPTAFDVAIDRTLYSRILEAYNATPRGEREKIKPFVALDVDSYHILTILRAKLWELTPSEVREFLLPRAISIGGAIIDQLIDAADAGAAAQVIAQTTYRKLLPTEAQDIPTLLRSLEERFTTERYTLANKAYTRWTFSNAVLLAALILKELEVRNLVTIAVGLAERLPTSDIVGKLLRVS